MNDDVAVAVVKLSIIGIPEGLIGAHRAHEVLLAPSCGVIVRCCTAAVLLDSLGILRLASTTVIHFNSSELIHFIKN